MRRKSPHEQGSASGGGQRRLRVGERIRHILAKVMREESFLDPALADVSSVSVTAVDVSPDLKNATAYVMPLGGRNATAIVEALNRAAGFLRSAVAPELDLRYTPRLSFRIDNSFDEAERVANLLNQERVQRDLSATDTDED
jgi:ribosome-binding factor A